MEARYIEKDGVKYYAVGHSESTVHVPGEGPATTVSEILKHVPTFEDTSIVLEGDQPAINPDILQGINEAKNLANGVIAESGSNNDGDWIRFSDGTQICWHEVELSYDKPEFMSGTWTYPKEFLNSIVSGNRNVDYSNNRVMKGTFTGTGGTTSTRLRAYAALDLNFEEEDTGDYQVMAIGRWK